MSTIDSPTGPRPKRSIATDRSPLSFPKDLIHPPLSQVSFAENAVSAKVNELDGWAQRLGEGFGISFTSFTLNPADPNLAANNLGLAVLVALSTREERISLERRTGRWGLYFTREPAALSTDRKSDAVLLRDAPLDIRERFLTKSEQFFREYLALCQDRLGRMKICVEQADRTVQLLNNLKLS